MRSISPCFGLIGPIVAQIMGMPSVTVPATEQFRFQYESRFLIIGDFQAGPYPHYARLPPSRPGESGNWEVAVATPGRIRSRESGVGYASCVVSPGLLAQRYHVFVSCSFWVYGSRLFQLEGWLP